MLLECAHFVHRCNNNQWPEWMRSGVAAAGVGGYGSSGGHTLPPNIRTHTVHSQSTQQSARSAQPPNSVSNLSGRRQHQLQRAAGRAFYAWACSLGLYLNSVLDKENVTAEKIVTGQANEQRRRLQRIEDDLENFLDEGVVNAEGNASPMALKLLAVMLLLEITAFLRETFNNIPRSRVMVTKTAVTTAPSHVQEEQRRWSILSTTFTPLQQMQRGSITSIGELAEIKHRERIDLSFVKDEQAGQVNGARRTWTRSAAPLRIDRHAAASRVRSTNCPRRRSRRRLSTRRVEVGGAFGE